jgi:glucans biosynthesis protein
MIDRRTFLATAASTATLAAMGYLPSAAAAQIKFGSRTPFSFDGLVARAKAMAGKPYEAPKRPPQEILDRIDYAAHGQIQFKPEYALFADGPGQFPVTFFHMGRFFYSPVQMHIVGNEGGKGWNSREIIYKDEYFDMPADSPAHELPAGSGFAGFRFQESRQGDQSKLDWKKNDWVAFLGASYFRAIGELYQYGLSARGIAIDIAVPEKPEEFPFFTQIYFETPKDNSDTVTIFALLDGPSISGAFRFDMQRGKSVLMNIDAALFVRKDIERLGIAPLTSMYWYSEAQKATAVDWRPEVHDSDGLAMWNGSGEYLWRPLNNAPYIIASSFSDTNPHGFGLLQRDRNFDHYLDGVHYERRPSLWVEPLNEWGEGAIQLVEIPTDDEIHDNIVAMWVPKAPATRGSAYRLKYKLYWSAEEPFPPTLARCVATRLGNGGQPGEPRPQGVRKFMVEFLGGPLANLPFGAKPEIDLSASRGTFSYVYTEAVPNDVPGHWRAQFDLTVDGKDPVEMRLFLKNGTQPLSETWLYQYHPTPNQTR